MQNYKLEREVKNRAELEKSTEEAKVRIGLWCHLVTKIIRSTSYWCSVAWVTDKVVNY